MASGGSLAGVFGARLLGSIGQPWPSNRTGTTETVLQHRLHLKSDPQTARKTDSRHPKNAGRSAVSVLGPGVRPQGDALSARTKATQIDRPPVWQKNTLAAADIECVGFVCTIRKIQYRRVRRPFSPYRWSSNRDGCNSCRPLTRSSVPSKANRT